jgi:GNAT superfamily N-acetyltransferase
MGMTRAASVGSPLYLSDHDMARRLERTEARSCAAFVEARARVSPECGAEWIDVHGTFAMFDGRHSPITQTFGLGMFSAPEAADLDRIEKFFGDRGAPVMHEVCPLADRSTMAALCARGYQPIEFTSVMFLPFQGRSHPETSPGAVRVRVPDPEEHETWARTSADGWRELAEFQDSMLDLARITAARSDIVLFLAEIGDRPIATAALNIHDGVALFAGASTIPEFRKRGGQRALLEARLSHAAAMGCGLAMMCAEPGSASQRNAERQGFRVAYTRVKWERR